VPRLSPHCLSVHAISTLLNFYGYFKPPLFHVLSVLFTPPVLHPLGIDPDFFISTRLSPVPPNRRCRSVSKFLVPLHHATYPPLPPTREVHRSAISSRASQTNPITSKEFDTLPVKSLEAPRRARTFFSPPAPAVPPRYLLVLPDAASMPSFSCYWQDSLLRATWYGRDPPFLSPR